jgi:hypothetical protein
MKPKGGVVIAGKERVWLGMFRPCVSKAAEPSLGPSVPQALLLFLQANMSDRGAEERD